MKQFISFLVVILLLLPASMTSFAASATTPDKGEQFSATPSLNNGKKWRCAYYEGGQYPDYQIIFKATLNGLIRLGWIEPIEFPDYKADHKAFWLWLHENAKSEYLEFVQDGFYSSDFKAKLRKEIKEIFLKRLEEKNDIDFIFAMGTWAGQDLANERNKVPTIVASSSDPIASKIVASAEDSGWDHLHAKVDPDRYQRQVQLFYDMVGFNKLGVVYEDSVEGRTYAAVSAIEKAAQERNFEIVSCKAPFSNVRKREAEARVVDCYQYIATKADAVYITVHQGVTLANLPNILGPLQQNKLPTFSMKGSEEVEHGVLMSISQANFKYVGQFHAEVMGKILNGAQPRALNQIWRAPGKIALNLKSAQIIGFDPPVDILMASDEIFETVKVAEEKR